MFLFSGTHALILIIIIIGLGLSKFSPNNEHHKPLIDFHVTKTSKKKFLVRKLEMTCDRDLSSRWGKKNDKIKTLDVVCQSDTGSPG